MTLLVYVPISNRAWAVERFTQSLYNQKVPSGTQYYFNVNDSTDDTFDDLQNLEGLKDRFPNMRVVEHTYNQPQKVDHSWDEMTILKMVKIRNHALGMARDNNFHWLLMVDSDVVFPDPDTFMHLMGLELPIVSPVFYATWGKRKAEPLPNVWSRGQYELSPILKNLLKRPGHYLVGGLGAVTLIRRDVILAGVTYDPPYNKPSDLNGEDRYFCLRAAIHGFHLHACTCMPVSHLER